MSRSDRTEGEMASDNTNNSSCTDLGDLAPGFRDSVSAHISAPATNSPFSTPLSRQRKNFSAAVTASDESVNISKTTTGDDGVPVASTSTSFGLSQHHHFQPSSQNSLDMESMKTTISSLESNTSSSLDKQSNANFDESNHSNSSSNINQPQEQINHNWGSNLTSSLNTTSSQSPSVPTVRVRSLIGPQHFDLLKLIGEGAFGKVILVRNLLDSQLYAMKVISKKLLKKKNNVAYMKSERDILTKVSHPFVVSLHFAFQTESKLFLVMDFLSGGELFFHLKRRGLILEAEARFFFGEMILAIDFLHGMGVIHRDLKPENVLLRGDGHICLTDFGLAKEIGDSEKIRTLCGTSEYMAPEMIARNGYTRAVDWWSLGALFYEMLTGKPPFQGKTTKELDRKILTEKVVTPPYLTAHAHSLLKGMLEKDPTKRLGAAKGNMFSIGGVSQLKQHPFFSSLHWNKLEYLEIDPPNTLNSNTTTTTINNNNIMSGGGASSPTSTTSPPPLSSSSSSSSSSAVSASVGVEGSVGKDGNKVFNDNKMNQSNNNGDAVIIKNNQPDYDYTQHFHEGFTTQCISPSVLEETLSGVTSPSRRLVLFIYVCISIYIYMLCICILFLVLILSFRLPSFPSSFFNISSFSIFIHIYACIYYLYPSNSLSLYIYIHIYIHTVVRDRLTNHSKVSNT